MAKVSDKELALAKVYSEAMLQIAQSSGEADGLLGELLDLASLSRDDAAFRGFLDDPTIDADRRRVTIEKLFRGKYSDLFVDSLQVLNSKDRLALIEAVAETYRLLHEEACKRVEVFVQTASPLTEALRTQLRQVAQKQTGLTPDLVESIDKSLLGGVVMRVGDTKYDASVASKLKSLATLAHERASHEIHGDREYVEGTVA